jgi:DNA-binding NarL/FixJ family response regulator
MRAIMLTADLMFSSRVASAATMLGVPFNVCMAPSRLGEQLAESGADTRLVIVDTTLPRLDWVALVAAVREQAPQAAIVAFGPHVDVAALQAAAAAGCDEVLSRGQFQQCYTALLDSKCRVPAGPQP